MLSCVVEKGNVAARGSAPGNKRGIKEVCPKRKWGGSQFTVGIWRERGETGGGINLKSFGHT